MANKNDVKHNKGMNPLTAGAIGAGIGALAGAATVVLSDEGNRKKLGKKIAEIEKGVKDSVKDTQKKVKTLEAQASKKLKSVGSKKKAK